MPSVVRMSSMETRHARKDRRHNHTITIVYMVTWRYRLHSRQKRRFAIAFIPDCGFYFSIRYDERNLVGISEHFYFTDTICTVCMMIHETHLTKSRTTLSWWLSRVSLLWLLSPFFLVSFLFLSTEQPYLTFPCLCSSPTCFDRLGSLIQHFFLAPLKRPLNSKRNYALRNNNVAKGNKNEDKRMHGYLYL